MNDSESAGGGHQGSTPAPPAVTDYKTILSAAPTVTSSSSSTNQTAPSVLTIVTTNARTTVTPTSSITSVSSGTSRNFQLVFTQQSPTPQQQLQQQHKPKLATTQLAPKAIVGVQQKQQYSASHMPQTSSSRLATGANSQPTITSRVKSSYTPVNQTDVKDITGESIPLAKRQKVDLTPDSVVGNSASIVVGSLLPATGSTVAPSIATAPTPQDINALKKRILEHKYLRLRSLKEKHNENVAELFYLQNGGNMMDFPTWRKKPHTPQFISFSNAFRLEQLIHDEKAAAAAVSASQQQNVENIATIIGVSGTIGQHQLKQQKQVETSNTPTTASAKAQVSPTAPVTIPSSINPDTPKSTKTPAGSIDNNDSLISDSSNSPLPQGAEIKIPSVGATPVAVSTKLPAAVVQLSQQGGTPLVPCSTANGSSALRRNGNGISQIINASPGNVPGAQVNHRRATPPPAYAASPSGALAPSTTNGSSAAQSASGANASNAQEFSFKAKQEVYVLQRISELQREGLWTEKRLPKLQEPSRPKAHWDYLLEEMVWLAADFAQERKWKKNAAKKCAKMVQKYFQDKASAAQKAEKAQEAHLKRIAAFISKEVKMFWSNVEKLVEYKHHTKLEEKRKKALDQHLSFIVDQTEKFSQQLAEGMNKNIQETTNPLSSVISSRKSSPKSESVHMTDDDFRPDSASDDDEETIAKADEEEASNVKEEVAALEKESQMDLDDFINELPKGYLENRDKILPEVSPKGNEKDDTDGDFEAGEESADDENTIDEQEEEEMDVDHQKELDELEADNDLTVAQLMERYKSDKPTHAKSQILVDEKSTVSADSDDDEQEESVDSDDFSEADTDDETVEETASEAEEIEQEDCLKSLLEENETHTNSKDDMIKDAAALAESLQPKGNTLSSTNVVTPVPFLLKHSLREYQHIGLDWLVTMNERKLNGILADEMGLGKTIQTIALLAHLACVKGNWGPHLIVVPSSVMLNWEMEFKKWCPGFKILTYYGTQKERKMKRVGWTKPNAFHVCISSYKLVVQDQQSFRRKKWKYLILDEAQNIKNFKSQRWQLLLNFSTERRLLLTGTPLQNDLMELWSLMHFLMPYVFSSHREFKEWFSNPMTGMIEGNMEYNETLITRLHKVIRPFLLRRLKKEVEKQMPKKYEHVIMCRLSNRQRYLYDDFMSRAKTKETLQTGNLLSVINVLMQLRKVCNHPNMFEVRPTISPFQMEGIGFETARLVCDLMEYDPFSQIDLCTLNLLLVKLELTLSAYVSHKCRLLMPPRKLIEEIDTMAPMPPPCPTGKYKLYVRVRDQEIQTNLSTHGANIVRVGASPAMKTEGNKLVPTFKIDSANSKISKRITIINPLKAPRIIGPINISKTGAVVLDSSRLESSPQRMTTLTSTASITTAKLVKIVNPDRRQLEIRPIKPQTLVDTSTVTGRPKFIPRFARPIEAKPLSHRPANRPQKSKLVTTLVQQVKTKVKTDQTMDVDDNDSELADNTSEADPIYNMAEILQRRKEQRLGRLKLMAAVNKRRSEATPIYGEDCRESLRKCLRTSRMLEYSTWQSRGYTNCCVAMQRSDNWTLNTMIKTHETRCHEMKTLFANFILYVPPACAPRMRLYVRNLATTRIHQQREVEETLNVEISPKLRLLHPIMSAMTTQFPDPRLIQYDCGKLQTLDRLLRQLKSEQHRVLIFTQMTKMLDILEAFLNHHGHIYLRLDGATRVEQRQVLMERFNGDKRIFCFILSTRSGGVGVNLTGADTVIFYDSDWNPTMDAQAQDRCHRIGQTRDVHIYRLVSEKTIEVNILKKANQKRMLSDMAIEGGNFTTTYFKSSTIKDLFDMEQQGDIEIDASVSASNKLEKPATEVSSEGDSEKHSLRAFETALAAAEDEQDVQATKTAKAEVAADLAEFDETIPIDEVQVEGTVELSKADLEVQNLVKQLSPIERYAMRFVEETGAAWTAEQLRAAEEEIEAQKREWEANRLAALQKEEELLKQEAEAEEMMTYSRKDASNQIWISSNTMEKMPMWCPPTPPQGENDIYIDHSLSFMYDLEPMPTTELPPVYVRKEYKRSRADVGYSFDCNRRPAKIRREDNIFAPRSLFDRPSAAIARIRRDLKNQRYRGVFKPNVQIPGLKPPMPQKPLVEPDGMSEWSVFEDMAILDVLVNLQGLPCNLMLLSPGHTPNWELVADVVNFYSKTFRSPKQCRWRYEAVIQPREEGKLVDSPKKQKKIKGAMMKCEQLKGPLRYLRSTQLYAADNNVSFTKLMRARFDCVKTAYLKKAPPPKRHFNTPSMMNPKHMEVLQEFGIVNYDQPIPPVNIAIMKANKIREKQRGHHGPPPSGSIRAPASQQVSANQAVHSQQQQQHQQQQTVQELVQPQQQQTSNTVTAVNAGTQLHTHQLQIQHIPSTSLSGVPQQSTATAIVLQHPSHNQQANPSAPAQGQQQIVRSAMGSHPNTTQIVKAIVAPSSGLLTTGQMQHITQQATVAGTQHVQIQQQQSGGATSSVSVVLTTPVQTLSTSQHHTGAQTSSTAQIVSISPQTISSSSQGASIVQTLPSQSLPQVVSVSQLTQVGTVLTTSASLQPNATVTTLNTSALRAQRIVAAASGTLQDVVLQQRSGNPSPTIVSMSSLGQSVTPAQFQAAQLRLTSMPSGTQQVVTKGIPVTSLQQANKIASAAAVGNQPAHIQLYRQRQQLKVLQAQPSQSSQTVVQTASGQTALVNASGAIIQGNLMQTSTGPTTVQVQGQKVAVASSAGATPGGVVTSVATVQVQHTQGRTQFIKQVSGKQALARQVGESDMLLVKRQVIPHNQQKTQVLQQGQIFASSPSGAVTLQQQVQTVPAGAGQQQTQAQVQQTQQVQQVTQQQIATLVKASGSNLTGTQNSGSVSVTATQQGTVNMALSHLKPGGQIKVAMANQSQMRQLQMQQHLAMPRKINRMAQLAAAVQASTPTSGGVVQTGSSTSGPTSAGVTVATQKSPSSGVQTQLVHIQNTKSLPSSVTVQQIQQVMRQGQPGALAATGLVLGKTSVGRVIPVTVASQSNQRQTIQVVSAASAQALAASNIRAHVASGQNITGTIKVATGSTQSQTQQAIITAIQQQAAAQQNQRQNASPVRLQTTASGNLVAVVQQQTLPQQQQQQQQQVQQQQTLINPTVGSPANSGQQTTQVPEVMTITQTSAGNTITVTQQQQQQQQQQQIQTAQQQQTTPQQVRTLVKKKIMQIRSEKE